MSALCFSEPTSGRSYLWIGNSRNFGCDPAQGGHLNLGFECEAAMVSQWLKWFASAWIESAPLTPLTANIPDLVPARGTKEAADNWREYEELCRQLRAPEKTKVDASNQQQILSLGQEDEENSERAIVEICKDMGIPPPDPLQEKIARLMAKGQVVTIDKGSRTPPLELPIAKWLRASELGTERISFKADAGIRIFDEKDIKDLEKLRKGLTELLVKLTYPLADGVRWMPLKVQPLLERERLRLEKEAKHRLGALIHGGVAEFVSSKRRQIEEEINEIYAKLHPNEPLPTGTINLIVRDLEDRLVKATGEHFLPRVSYASQQFSFRSPSDHVAQWAPARTLLGAIAEHGRRAVSKKDHLRGHEIPERELLEAMNVCDDHILRTRHDSKIVHAAKRELFSLEEILADESDDRSKSERILRLIQGPEQASSDSSLAGSNSAEPARPATGDQAGVGERATAASEAGDPTLKPVKNRQEIIEHIKQRFAEGKSRGLSMAQVADEARQRLLARMAQRDTRNGEDASRSQSHDSHQKHGDLNSLAAAALSGLSPELLKVELLNNLSRVMDEYSDSAKELLQTAELRGIRNLDDLAEYLEALSPVELANELVLANPGLDLTRLLYLPPLEPFKAVLAMYMNADR